MIEIKEIINTHLVEALKLFYILHRRQFCNKMKERAQDKRALIAYKKIMSVRHQFCDGQ